MAAMATGLMRSLALARATPSYQHGDVHGLVPAAVVLAKLNCDPFALCFTGSQFLCNAPALRRLRGRKTSCAADVEDMDGYTSMKEFLPFVAARLLPLVNVSKVSQIIDADSLTVENVVSFTGPYMTTSFTNCASFDVRSPKRVQFLSSWASPSA